MEKDFKIDLSWMDNIRGDFEYKSPEIPPLIDRKTKLLYEIYDNSKDINKNTKKQLWKDILFLILGAICGNLFPYLISLIFQNNLI